jgi:hypothetical protein
MGSAGVSRSHRTEQLLSSVCDGPDLIQRVITPLYHLVNAGARRRHRDHAR